MSPSTSKLYSSTSTSTKYYISGYNFDSTSIRRPFG